MNEFIEVKVSELDKKRELAKQIAILCLAINSIGDERKSEQGKPCVFLNLSGHVGNIDVGVNEKGWELNRRPDKLFRLNEYSSLSEFTDCLAYLERLYIGQTIEPEKKNKCDDEGKELSGETRRKIKINGVEAVDVRSIYNLILCERSKKEHERKMQKHLSDMQRLCRS